MLGAVIDLADLAGLLSTRPTPMTLGFASDDMVHSQDLKCRDPCQM